MRFPRRIRKFSIMSMGQASVTCVAVLSLACVNTVVASGLRDFSDGWLLSVAEVDWVLTGTKGHLNSQLSYAGNRGVWVGSGKTFLFGIPELPVTSLQGGLGNLVFRNELNSSFSWERTGNGIFVEDWKEFQFRVGKRNQLGLKLRKSEILIGGELEASHFEILGVLSVNRHLGRETWIRFIWRFELFDAPSWYGNHSRRQLAYVSLLQNNAGLGLGIALDRTGDGRPGLSLEFSTRLSRRSGLGLRADPPTGSLGPITYWKAGRLMVRTCHVVHPYLGLTHRVSLTIGNLQGAHR